MFNKFSPSEAAVSVFEFTKLHSKFVLRYSLFYALFQVISVLLLATSGYFGMLRQLIAIDNSNLSDEAMKALLASINVPVFLIFIFISIAFGLMFLGMVLRKTVNNQEIGYYGFTWGKDETNLLIAGLTLIGIYFASFFVAGMIGAIFAAFGSAGDVAQPIILALVSVFIIWFVISISQYGVVSVANGKFNLKEILAETKEQFWSYFGAYLLAFVLVLIATLIIQSSLGAIFGMSSFKPENLEKVMPSNIGAALTPKFVLYYFALGIFSGFTQIAFACVGSYAYHKKREIINHA